MKPNISCFFDKNHNFGDQLTIPILHFFTRNKCTYSWAPPQTCDILGIGSYMHRIIHPKTKFTGYVWTTGCRHPMVQPNWKHVPRNKLIAARGQISYQLLDRYNEHSILGDGGLLVRYVYNDLILNKTSTYQLGIIPHFVEYNHVMQKYNIAKDPNILVISLYKRPVQDVIKDMCKCKYIISSSLHGLIVSDALNIPNHHITIPNVDIKIDGGLFKYNDYYSIYPENIRCAPIEFTPDLSLDQIIPQINLDIHQQKQIRLEFIIPRLKQATLCMLKIILKGKIPKKRKKSLKKPNKKPRKNQNNRQLR